MSRNITVTFSDGTTARYENAPDDLTPDFVLERVKSDYGDVEVTKLDGGRTETAVPLSPAQTVNKEIVQPTASIAKDLAGKAYDYVAEPLMTVGSSLVATPLAWTKGLLSLGFDPPSPSTEQPQKGWPLQRTGSTRAREIVDATMRDYTFTPRSEGGRSMLGMVAYPFQKLSEGAEWTGEKVKDLTGSDLSADIAQAGVEAIPMVASPAVKPMAKLGVDAVKGVGRAIGKSTPNIRPSSILREGLRENISAKTDDIMQALVNAKEGQTTGEALAYIPESTDIAAYQRALARSPGENLAPKFLAKESGMADARLSVVHGIAGDEKLLKAAESFRRNAAEISYGAAGKEIVAADKSLIGLLERPSLKGAVKKSNIIRSEQGRPAFPAVGEDISIDQLHLIKLALDDKINPANPSKALDRTHRAALVETNKELVAWMKAKSGGYKSAIDEFEQNSIPINRMKVGQALENKLRSALDASETPKGFVESVKDPSKLIEDSTGFSHKGLKDILSSDQVAIVEGVATELKRKAKFEDVASKSAGTEISAREMTRKMLPGLLSRPMMLTKFIANWIAEHKYQPTMENMAADMMRNPEKLAKFLRNEPSSTSRITEALLKERVLPYSAPLFMQGALGGGSATPVSDAPLRTTNVIAQNGQKDLPMTSSTEKDRSFAAMIPAIIDIEGGDTEVRNDGGKGLTRMGLNAEAIRKTPEQLRAMTQTDMLGVYREEYWDAVGADELPPNIRAMAFDAAINQGVASAKRMLAKAKRGDGSYDVEEFIEMRIQRYKGTLDSKHYRNLSDAEKQQNFTSWMNRIERMKQFT